MTDSTPNLDLPYIMPAQAQKHVTHNEAIRALDALVQLAVIDQTLAVPPPDPNLDGTRYIVGRDASGIWRGHDGELAAYQDGAWIFYTPQIGWRAWVENESALVAWDGVEWVSTGGSPNPTPLVGVNATADGTNRLSVSSTATLFNHDGGGHQLKINKAQIADTASTLYQTGFSGRAEMGLTGDDDFHFKVSSDGAVWRDALTIDRATGRVSLPETPLREVLSANRVYYVATNGNNNNDGLTSAAPFATIAAAVAKTYTIDPNGYSVTIQLADGTYTANSPPISINRPLVGGARLWINGNPSAPGNVVLVGTGYHTVSIGGGANVQLQNLELQSTGSGSLLYAGAFATVNISNVTFNAASRYHMEITTNALLSFTGNYTIAGSALVHIDVRDGGIVTGANKTAILIGALTFSNFCLAGVGGLYSVFNHTWSGAAATGRRYNVFVNGMIRTYGKGETHFPGDVAGLVSSGGRYS